MKISSGFVDNKDEVEYFNLEQARKVGGLFRPYYNGRNSFPVYLVPGGTGSLSNFALKISLCDVKIIDLEEEAKRLTPKYNYYGIAVFKRLLPGENFSVEFEMEEKSNT